MTFQSIGEVAGKVVNRWAWWQAALANPNEIGKSIIASPDHPEQGFYKTRYKDKPWEPVAIWWDEEVGRWIAYRSGREVDPLETWNWCCRHPITHEAYDQASRGGGWADDDPTVAAQIAPVPPGHNSGDVDEAEILRDQIEAAKQGADAYKVIADEETLTKAQSLRARLNELSGEADKKREALKRPHLDAGNAVDAKWQPLVKGAKEAANGIRRAMETYQTEKLRKQRDAEAAAAAARLAEAQQNIADKQSAGEDAAADIREAAAAAQAMPSPIKGTYGKAASVGVKNVVREVTDWDALWGFLREHPEVRDLFQKLAQRAVDRNFTVPGVRVEEEATVR